MRATPVAATGRHPRRGVVRSPLVGHPWRRVASTCAWVPDAEAFTLVPTVDVPPIPTEMPTASDNREVVRKERAREREHNREANTLRRAVHDATRRDRRAEAR